jgi:hypothetical protein
MYQDIAYQPCFTFDHGGLFSNNTVHFLPTLDLWLLAVLNAPVSWWFAWRGAQHGKDEALRLFRDFMVDFPIPRPTDAQREPAETYANRLIEITAEQHAGLGALLDWLRSQFALEKPSQKLQDVATLDADILTAEVQKARGKRNPLTAAQVKALKAEHARSVTPLQALAAEARQLERRVAELVNAAYGLTAEEVALMWRTAPPRMPGEAPGMRQDNETPFS